MKGYKFILFVVLIIIGLSFVIVKTPFKNIEIISSNTNLNQTGLSIEEIDLKIQAIIEKQIENELLNEDLEVPYNHKKLDYLGFIHPNDTGLFKTNPIQKKNTAELNKKLHIYKYGYFYISIEDRDTKSIWNLEHTLRAIDILKYRYPEIYDALFFKTFKFYTEKPEFGNWVNTNKAFWIAYNTNPKHIASNNTVFLKDGYFKDSKIEKYSNIAVVNIHSESILGKSTSHGSRPLYNLEKDTDNHIKYLKDGLIESICHEMIHNYIDLVYTYNQTIHIARKLRGTKNFNYAEENAVLNTSLSYFEKKGGLDKKLIAYYYKNTFDSNITALKNANKITEYGNKFASDIDSKSWKEVFLIDIFN